MDRSVVYGGRLPARAIHPKFQSHLPQASPPASHPLPLIPLRSFCFTTLKTSPPYRCYAKEPGYCHWFDCPHLSHWCPSFTPSAILPLPLVQTTVSRRVIKVDCHKNIHVRCRISYNKHSSRRPHLCIYKYNTGCHFPIFGSDRCTKRSHKQFLKPSKCTTCHPNVLKKILRDEYINF